MRNSRDDRRWPCRPVFSRLAGAGSWLGIALLGTAILGGARAADKEPIALLAAAKSAVAKGNVEKTRMLGSQVDESFREAPAVGGVLVGFEIGLGTWGDDDIICTLRPIYLTERGDLFTKEYGAATPGGRPANNKKPPPKNKVQRRVTLKAESGYAVGAVTIRSGMNLDGLSLTYMRIKGEALDPEQSYTSEWVGRRKGGGVATLGGDGAAFVGVYGTLEDRQVRSLGLLYLNKPAPPPPPPVEKPVEPPPVVPPPPPRRVIPVIEPEDPPPAKKPAPPPVQEPPAAAPAEPPPIRRDVYHDPEYRYNFVLPAGWQKMPAFELKQGQDFVSGRMPGQEIRYDAGFRRSGARAWAYPYILVQVQPIDSTNMSYDDIERTMSRDLNVGIEKAKEAVSDLASNVSVGSAVLDRWHNCIVMRMEMSAGSFGMFGKIQGLSVCHFGARHLVSLHCYARDEDFQTYLPAFTTMNNSFYFDDGYEFVAAPSSSSAGSSSGAGLVAVVVFVIVAIPIGLLSFFFVRKGSFGGGQVRPLGAGTAGVSEEVLDVLPVSDAESQGFFEKPPGR
jgi:hypothetical protein